MLECARLAGRGCGGWGHQADQPQAGWVWPNWELETENDKVVFIVSQTLAMRERLTQIFTVLAVSECGFEKVEAECEVSGVTRILLKAHLVVLQVILQPLVGQLPEARHLPGHLAVVLGGLDYKEISCR